MTIESQSNKQNIVAVEFRCPKMSKLIEFASKSKMPLLKGAHADVAAVGRTTRARLTPFPVGSPAISMMAESVKPVLDVRQQKTFKALWNMERLGREVGDSHN